MSVTLCGCGCGTEIVTTTKGRSRKYLDDAHRKHANSQAQALRDTQEIKPDLSSIDQTRPAPKFCGLCPFQGAHGVRPCTHPRLASRWMTYHAASEARIHGGCPWGRPIISHEEPKP